MQSGFGRTGRWFASEHFGVVPDIVVTAKALGGGLPLGGVTGPAAVMDAVHVGGLGGTFGGNPVACAAALAVIEQIEREGLLARAEAVGATMMDALRGFQERFELIGDVRGLGAMAAMELVKDRETKEPAREETAEIVKTCYERGLIIMRAGAGANVLRTLMPLVITDDELEEGLTILEGALAKAAGSG